jgi:hypothetical protein
VRKEPSAVSQVPADFAFAGTGVACSWLRPGLLRPSRGLADVLVADPEPRPANSTRSAALHGWHTAEGDEILSVSRLEDGFILRFPGVAGFGISPDARTVRPWPAIGTSTETLGHLLIDQVLPRLLAHRGQLVLHAAGIRMFPGMVVAFVGDSGRGKSTLAASFSRTGEPILSDDAIVLRDEGGTVHALATYPSLRLWPDSLNRLYEARPDVMLMADYSTKRRVSAPHPADEIEESTPLAALYLLGLPPPEANEVLSIEQVTPRNAVIPLLSSTFQLDVTDRHRTALLFERAASIADRLPVFELRYPRDFRLLPAVRDAINEHIETLRSVQHPTRTQGGTP